MPGGRNLAVVDSGNLAQAGGYRTNIQGEIKIEPLCYRLK